MAIVFGATTGCDGVHVPVSLQTKIHERQPIILGCSRDVDIITALYAEEAGAAASSGGASGDVGETAAKKARTD